MGSHGASIRLSQFFIFFATIWISALSVDYYSVLGIGADAQPQQIKQAYRKLSLKWHPDRHQKDKDIAHEKFIEIGEAYGVLSDPKKKAVYDQYGKEGLDRGMAEDRR